MFLGSVRSLEDVKTQKNTILMQIPIGAFQFHAINSQINIQIKHNWVKNPN